MGANDRQRNNVRAGAFVIAAIVIGLLIVVVLSDSVERFLRPERSYAAHFTLEAGVMNLQPGGGVRIGGVPVGRVSSVKLIAADGGTDAHVDVRFTVDRRFELRDDATIKVSSALVGADVWIDVLSIGEGELLAAGQPITVDNAPSTIENLIGPQRAARFDRILKLIEGVGADVQTLVGDVDDRVNEFEPILAAVRGDGPDAGPDALSMGEAVQSLYRSAANVETLTDTAGGVARDVSERWPAWREEIDSTFALIDDKSATISEGIDNAAELAERINTAWPAYDERIQRTLRSADEAVGLVNEKLVPTYASLGEEVAKDWISWSEELTETLVQARMASQQAGLAIQEIRRNPWSVLYRPGEKEVENERLYEATRSFAVAANDLRVASEITNRLIDRYGDDLSEHPDIARMMREQFGDRLDRFSESQQVLLELLRDAAP